MGKCSNCGLEYPDSIKFCQECGGKVIAKQEPKTMVMRCSACGGTMNIDEDRPIMLCPFCGSKELIVENDAVAIERIKQRTHKEIELGKQQLEREKIHNEQQAQEKEEEKARLQKFKRGAMSKILVIFAIISVFISFFAFSDGYILSGIIGLTMFSLFLGAFLIGMQVIKERFRGMRVIATILAFILIIPYFSCYGNNSSYEIEPEKFEWTDIILHEHLPEPQKCYGDVGLNYDDQLSVDIYKMSEDNYQDYKNSCINAGYAIEPHNTGMAYEAFNTEGYFLRLSYWDSNEKLSITLKVPEKMEQIDWPTNGLATLIPRPESLAGKINDNSDTKFSVNIGETSFDAYKDYINACEDAGFTVDVKKQEKYFSAKNTDAFKVTVEYKGNNVVYITIVEPQYNIEVEVECVKNLMFSQYDVDIYIDDVFQGAITHGDKESYDLVLNGGPHTISFESTEDETLDGEIELIISKDETIKLEITCSSFGVDVEVLAGTLANETTENETNDETSVTELITLTMGKDDFKGMELEVAEEKFREMGFTEFEYKTVDTEDESAAGKISYIEITEFLIGKSNFSKDDKVLPNSTITFYSYQYKKPEPVSYSTNDYETAKQGNTGIFAYVDDSGIYDIYWIIDFDEGYVYWFTDGNGDGQCDRLKIESGNLNTVLIITYHDGGTEWSNGLHFKYKNQPNHLIMQDQDGFEYNYYSTDLEEALAIRSTKNIKDY